MAFRERGLLPRSGPSFRRRCAAARSSGRSRRRCPQCLTIQPAGRTMSHKLTTYFSASISSCSVPNGLPLRGKERGVFRWLPGSRQGACRPLILKCIDSRAGIYSDLWPSIFNKLLILLELQFLTPCLSSKLACVLQRDGLCQLLAGDFDRARGGRGTTDSGHLIWNLFMTHGAGALSGCQGSVRERWFTRGLATAFSWRCGRRMPACAAVLWWSCAGPLYSGNCKWQVMNN